MTGTISEQSKNKKRIRFVVFNGIIAALYVVLSYYIGRKNKWLGIIPPVVANGIIVGGYLPFLIVDPGSTVTVQAVVLTMLSVAGGDAAVLVVLGLPLVAIIEKTGLKNKLP
ncbi:MAG: hypothetical protein K5779_03500 [Saccharofermentans sp.]|nr:hypothetical protein [Saccharofermentans sp.]